MLLVMLVSSSKVRSNLNVFIPPKIIFFMLFITFSFLNGGFGTDG